MVIHVDIWSVKLGLGSFQSKHFFLIKINTLSSWLNCKLTILSIEKVIPDFNFNWWSSNPLTFNPTNLSQKLNNNTKHKCTRLTKTVRWKRCELKELFCVYRRNVRKSNPKAKAYRLNFYRWFGSWAGRRLWMRQSWPLLSCWQSAPSTAIREFTMDLKSKFKGW